MCILNTEFKTMRKFQDIYWHLFEIIKAMSMKFGNIFMRAKIAILQNSPICVCHPFLQYKNCYTMKIIKKILDCDRNIIS
jgi:hypothetical protein